MENDSRRMENDSRRMENDSRRMDKDFDDSKRVQSIQEAVATTMVEAIAKLGDNADRSRDPPPAWEKTISFSGWRRSVEMWSDNNTKPSKKANMLLEMIKKDTDHDGLKEMIIHEVIENEEFYNQNVDVIKTILDKINEFVEETKWKKNVRLAREFFDFKQETIEDSVKYVTRFSASEAKMKNEKILMSKIFKTGVLLNQSTLNIREV